MTGGVYDYRLSNGSLGNKLNLGTGVVGQAANSSVFSSCASAYEKYYTSLQYAWVNTLPFNMTYSRPAVCEKSLSEFCLIWVDGVDLLYWPTAYATGGARATTSAPALERSELVSDDFTFTQGSAYLVYKNAKAILPYNTAKSTTGPFYPSLTVAYPESSLSTYLNCNPSGFWPAKSINFEDFNQPPKWSVVSEQRSCHVWSIYGDSLQDATFPSTEIASDYSLYTNQPLVLLPAPLTNIDPTWRTCTMGDTGIGLFDPPRPLESASDMIPVTTDIGPPLAEVTAQPGSAAATAGPAPTGIAIHLPNGNTIIDFPPPGASLNAPSQTRNSPSSTGLYIASRPLPFNPDNLASPAAKGAGGSGESSSESPIAGSQEESEPAAPGRPGAAQPVVQNAGNQIRPPAVDQQSDEVLTPQQAASPKNQPDTTQEAGPQPAPIHVGGYNIQAEPSGGIVINEATLDASHPSSTVGGVQAVLGSSGVVVGGNTYSVPEAGSEGTNAPVIINGHSIQISHGSQGENQLVIDNSPLPAGVSQTQVAGNAVSVMPNGQVSVLPTVLPYIPLTPGRDSQTPITSASGLLTPYRLQDGDIVVAGSTLSAGGPPAVISGTPVSVIGNGQAVKIGSQIIQPIPTTPPSSIGAARGLGIVVDGETMEPFGNHAVILSGSTVSAGEGQFTLKNGKMGSITGGNLIIGSQTIPIPGAFVSSQTTTPSSVIDGHRISFVGTGNVAIDGMTLSKLGQTITLLGGEVASIGGGSLILGSHTIPIPQPTLAFSYESQRLVIHGDTIVPVGASGIAVDGTTFSRSGQTFTLADGTLATLTNGAIEIISQVLPLPPRTKPGIGYWIKDALDQGQLSTLSNGDVVYGSQTLSPGGTPITLSDGEVLSLQPDYSGSIALSAMFSGTARPMAVTSALNSAATQASPSSGSSTPEQTAKAGSNVSAASMARPRSLWLVMEGLLAVTVILTIICL